MARPPKQGLEYFSFDVDFFEDDKVQLVSAEYGLKGEIIIIRLLCLVYRNGYYYKWGDDESLLLAKRVGNGITGSLVSEVVKGLVKRSFFDERVFNSFQILTSRGIQKRYFEAASRRGKVLADSRLLLVDAGNYKNIVFVDINGVNVNINSINVDRSTQSKVKESKVINNNLKNVREEETPPLPATPLKLVEAIFTPPTEAEIDEQCESRGIDVDIGREFWNHFNSQGWVRSSGRQITNWKSQFNLWVLNKHRYENGSRCKTSSKQYNTRTTPSGSSRISDEWDKYLSEHPDGT